MYDRRRPGLLSRVASRTLHVYVTAALGEPDAVLEVISLAQSFGSIAPWHPHLHLLASGGAFRRDRSFVAIRTHGAAVLAEGETARPGGGESPWEVAATGQMIAVARKQIVS